MMKALFFGMTLSFFLFLSLVAVLFCFGEASPQAGIFLCCGVAGLFCFVAGLITAKGMAR